MYLTIIFLPLLSGISSGFLGRKLGVKGSSILSTTCLFITCILTHLAFYKVALLNQRFLIKLADWIDLDYFKVEFCFNFDSLTVSMLLPVVTVSFLVHLYSIGYMDHDPHQQRFFSYLSMFTFFMVLLVTANNFLLMFVGWEGVGVSSYLLVNFWFTRIQANKSALNAILTNRVGDMFLTVGLFVIIAQYGNLDYQTVFSLAYMTNENIVTLIGILLLLGAMAKSAQLGLHIWLPMAMEGPTPVSALIHAATMVTAGVYLLMRGSPLLEYSSLFLLLTMWIGGFTAIFAATTGLFQNDLKKVIAYSTCSQLGMLFVAVGLSQSNIALFHLVNHAYFKSLLFLGAGSVIHAFHDQQDMRKYGGLRSYLPFSYSILLIGSLSLMAMPFLTGYYSKDLIIEASFGKFYMSSHIVYWLITITALFTSLYSVRLIWLTFLTPARSTQINYLQSHEPGLTMAIPLFILSLCSIFFGYIAKDFFVGLASTGNIYPFFTGIANPHNSIIIDTEFGLPLYYKLLPVILTLSSIILFFLLNSGSFSVHQTISNFFNSKYYLEVISNKLVVYPLSHLGYISNKIIDKGGVETIGPNGLVNFFTNVSNSLAKLDTGIITNYAVYILAGLVYFLFWKQGELFFLSITSLLLVNNQFKKEKSMKSSHGYYNNKKTKQW